MIAGNQAKEEILAMPKDSSLTYNNKSATINGKVKQNPREISASKKHLLRNRCNSEKIITNKDVDTVLQTEYDMASGD